MKAPPNSFLSAASIAVVFAVAVSDGGASTVIDANLSFSGGVTACSYILFQDAAATDYTFLSFGRDGPLLNYGLIPVDEGSDWYFANEGDVYSAATAGQGFFTAFNHPSPPSYYVGYQDFYFAMSTGRGPSETGGSARTVFGWVQMRNTPSGLTMLRSAITYDEPGIIVGTTTTVPEPGVVLFLGIAGVLAGSRQFGRYRKR